LVDPIEDNKFAYVWASNEVLQAADKIIIAVDKDGPGKALAEELARRIGKPKCWSVEWPDDCKDANDTLLKYGKAKVSNVVEEAEPWPIAGLYDANHYAEQVRTLYHDQDWDGPCCDRGSEHGQVRVCRSTLVQSVPPVRLAARGMQLREPTSYAHRQTSGKNIGQALP
jgi:hypothetical protein